MQTFYQAQLWRVEHISDAGTRGGKHMTPCSGLANLAPGLGDFKANKGREERQGNEGGNESKACHRLPSHRCDSVPRLGAKLLRRTEHKNAQIILSPQEAEGKIRRRGERQLSLQEQGRGARGPAHLAGV